jgi:alkaline phosphatase D
VKFVVDALEPDTEYDYWVETHEGPGPRGRFHTFADGPMSFRVAFGSCASTGSNHRIWNVLRDLNPLFFIHMGDFHYENIARNDPSAFRRAYERVLTSPRQSAFYRSTPIAYMWDDHDFGPDDCDGTSPAKPAALQTYQQNVPHYPLSHVDGEVETIQQAFTVGRVRFVMTDVRAERTPEDEPDGPQKTMLGKNQLAWFFEELEAARSRYPLVVWVNVVPWITWARPDSGHGWDPYRYERTLIADTIKELGMVDRLVIFSGDGHMVALDDGSNSNYASDRAPGEKAFPVIHGAPLDRWPHYKGGPYSHGAHAPINLIPMGKIQQFGLMDLEDEGDRIRLELSCRNSRGNVVKDMALRNSRGKGVKDMTLRMECGGGGCRVIP